MNKQEFRDYFWNMPAMKYYEPDLNNAKAQDMINNKDGQYLAGQKWDGEWNMAIILDDEVLMRGRNITTTGDYKNRADMVPHITKELLSLFPAGTVFLGELCFNDPKKTSKDVGTIMRCLPAKAIERQKTSPLYFKIFDRIGFEYQDLTKMQFIDRAGFMWMTKPHTYVDFIEFYNSDFLEHVDRIWADGGEGLVIIKASEPYRPGERKAWSSLKLKKQLGDIKVKVIDTLEPTKEFTGDTSLDQWKYWVMFNGLERVGSHYGLISDLEYNENHEALSIKPVTKPYFYGWVGAIRVDYNGNIIDVASGLTDAMREYFATKEAKQKIKEGNMYVTITGMEATKDSIRHPVFLRKEE